MALQGEEFLKENISYAKELSDALGKVNDALKSMGAKNGDIAKLGESLYKFGENELLF